jgi:hypothetical protein
MAGVSNRVSPPGSGKTVSFDYSKLKGNTQKQRALQELIRSQGYHHIVFQIRYL